MLDSIALQPLAKIYLLLLPSAALAVALVSFRIESSEGDKVPGPNLVPGQNLGNNLENTAAI
jgi:hypothetical protein